MIGSTRNSPYVLKKDYTNSSVIYINQNTFKKVLKQYHPDIEIFRIPDSAFIQIDKNIVIHTIIILEMKNQNIEGSVDDKIYVGDARREEYEEMFIYSGYECPKVYFGFILSEMLAKIFLYSNKRKGIIFIPSKKNII